MITKNRVTKNRVAKNRVVFAFVLFVLFVSISISNVAALIEKKSISDLTRDSDNIITGKVLSRESYWENGNVVVSADRHIKGNSDDQITVKVRGGTVGNIYAEVSDVPLFDNNEEVLLFLKDDSVVGWNQGKYSIQNNNIKETGEPLTEFINNIEQNLQIQTNNKNVAIEEVSTIPHITGVTPRSGPAIATGLGSSIAAQDSTQVTISGSSFGSTKGSVKFWRIGTTLYDATIVSWEDTKIVVKVPGKVSSGAKPGGYGNVQVFMSDGTHSDNYGNFDVTYSYGGGKFPGSKVTYMVSPNTADTADELLAIQAAADTWNNADANFGFVYGGPTSKTDITLDGENSVIWVNYDTGSVATTVTWWFGQDTKTILESDLVLNDLSINWSTDSSLTKMDVQTVATHEFGHWLQLLDLYGNNDSEKMMYGYVSVGGIKRVLNTNDIAGIKWIYGSNISIPTDVVPPLTTLSGAIEGITYSNNVTIELVAKDDVGGSGISYTTFVINDGQVSFYSTPFVVNSEGKNMVTYSSVDNAGNVEKSKQINFTIDKGGLSDILSYYKGLGQNPNVVETAELLKAADDWRTDTVPPGFSASVTTAQLLTLADEWRNS
jgi:Matrixin